METGLSAADIVAMTRDINGGNGNGNGAWDNPFIYLVWLALLGNGGLWGNRGNNGGNDFGGGSGGSSVERVIFEGFNNQDINGQLRGITQGLCDGFYAVNTGMLNGFYGTQSALCQGFSGINSGISNLGYQIQQCCCDTDKGIMQSAFQTQAGFNALGTQLAQCCCDMRYDMASQFCDTRNTIQNTTRDIIENQNGNTRAILDFLVQSQIADKDAQIAALTAQLSQSNQNAVIGARIDSAVAEVLRRTGNDCPTAAYIVQPPTPVSFPTNCCGAVQFGNGYGGCGGCA